MPTVASMAGSEEFADLALVIEYIAEIPGIERNPLITSHPARDDAAFN